MVLNHLPFGILLSVWQVIIIGKQIIITLPGIDVRPFSVVG